MFSKYSIIQSCVYIQTNKTYNWISSTQFCFFAEDESTFFAEDVSFSVN